MDSLAVTLEIMTCIAISFTPPVTPLYPRKPAILFSRTLFFTPENTRFKAEAKELCFYRSFSSLYFLVNAVNSFEFCVDFSVNFHVPDGVNLILWTWSRLKTKVRNPTKFLLYAILFYV